MAVLMVVENARHWPLDIDGAQVVSARDYLTERRFIDMRRARVFNLCRNYGYQSTGYYVSLLAEARGHKPLPSVAAMQDLRQSALLRIASEDLDEVIQKAFAHIRGDRFVLSIYFGRNVARRYDRLSKLLFSSFPLPLLRAEFVRQQSWILQSLRPIAANEIPQAHEDFVVAHAKRFFARPQLADKEHARYELAILYDPDEEASPSDERAIRRFVRAAERLSMRTTVIGRDDYGRIPEFDALFIRETTAVNHHTFRFARRAEAEGLVVIDDPTSIVRCSNKVYQSELFRKHDIACPKTLVVHKGNVDSIGEEIGFPVVLKRPDSSFSRGVEKASDADELAAKLEEYFRSSELVVAQAFRPSEFDWRVGVLAGKALFVCRYFMARGHWQIRRSEGVKRPNYGRVDTVDPADAPAQMVELAVKTANYIGEGLYGVDIKEVDGEFLVTEINDNPNIDAGCEDAFMGHALYDTIMQHIFDRIERRGSREAV